MRALIGPPASPQARSVLFTTLVLAVVLAAAPLSAQLKEAEAQPFGTHVGPHAPDPYPLSLDADLQEALGRAHGGFAAFREAHPGWIALYRENDGQPFRAFGPGYEVAPADATAEDLLPGAQAVLAEVLPRLQVDPADFRHLTTFETARYHSLHFGQFHRGTRVEGANFSVRIDRKGRLLLWASTVIDTSAVSAAATIDATAALQVAVGHLAREGFASLDTVFKSMDVREVVHVEEDRRGRVPTRAFRVDLVSPETPADWVILVDASNGEILRYWNDIRECGFCHKAHGSDLCDEPRQNNSGSEDPLRALLFLASITGTVSSVTHEGLLPSQTPQLTPAPEIRINFAGLNVLTDPFGSYTFNGGGTTVTVSSGLDGPWITGGSSTGVPASFATSSSSGILDIVFNDTNSNIGERDMVHFANKTHRYLKLRAPGITQLDTAMIGTANLTTGNCNAFYSPAAHSINFYTAANGCINSATSSTVVEHEYGHGISTRVFNAAGFSVPGYMGEGLSDCVAVAIEDTSLVGAGFQGVGTVIRNTNNTCQYPSSCGTAIHSRGLVIGGSFWSTRQQFFTAMGAAGKDLADTYFFQSLTGAPQNEIEILLEMLLLDDNDGNLTNGTPNLMRFYTGFTTQHGVPFPLPLVSVSVPIHANSRNQLHPYEIRARVESVTGSAVTSATLLHRVAGGSFSVVNMQNLGGNWFRGTIPNQAASGSVVEYYVSASAGGVVGTSPASAPTQVHRIETAPSTAFFTDGFETPSGWTSATTAGANDWHNNVHGNPNHAYDPASAFQGVLTFGNDLVPASNFNGNYPNSINNTLTSPVINCAGRTGVTLRYRRWLTVEDGLYDQARILVSGNGGSTYTQVWQNVVGTGSSNHIDTQWVDHQVSLMGIADNNPNVRIRFQLQSDGGVNFGGWNVDDLTLQAANVSSVLPLTLSGSGQAGTLLSVSVNGAASDVFALAVSGALTPTWYENLGTLSVDVTSPLTLILVPFALLPANGSFTVTTGLPPVLVGQSFHFQSVSFAGGSSLAPLISNVASVTVTP
jgi:hypothetical protein